MAGSDESRALALVLAATAGAQVAGWRVFDSLVPDPVDAVRRDLDLTSIGVQLAGAATLCVPPLRPIARWVNVCVHGFALALSVDSVHHPERFRRSRTSHLRFMLTPARIPVHIGAIGLTLWVTRSDRAPHHVGTTRVRPAVRPGPPRFREAAVDGETPESASPSGR